MILYKGEASAEAGLVEVLKREADPIISLIAEHDGDIVGHIMFSPVTLSRHEALKIMGLGPMVVLPAQQRRGTGSMLVKAGLVRCQELGYGAAVVLGHIGYYPASGSFQRYVIASGVNMTSQRRHSWLPNCSQVICMERRVR